MYVTKRKNHFEMSCLEIILPGLRMRIYAYRCRPSICMMVKHKWKATHTVFADILRYSKQMAQKNPSVVKFVNMRTNSKSKIGSVMPVTAKFLNLIVCLTTGKAESTNMSRSYTRTISWRTFCMRKSMCSPQRIAKSTRIVKRTCRRSNRKTLRSF